MRIKVMNDKDYIRWMGWDWAAEHENVKKQLLGETEQKKGSNNGF